MTPEIVTLRDSSGSEARILVNQGFNLYQFQAAVEDRTIDVLWSDVNFAGGGGHPALSGIPILFPFCGRIAGTSFEYEGRNYRLEEGDGQGNAIHGFALGRPWRLVSATESEATGEFQASLDDPTLLRRWPSDFRIMVRYSLAGNRLSCEIVVENPDTRPLPFALATHPYFRLPIFETGHAEANVVRVPARKSWELVDLMPTGRVESPEFLTPLREGTPLAEKELDCVLTDLETNRGSVETSISDLESGRRLVQRFDDSFKNCVVYTPPHREAICIEPYTAVPNPFHLEKQGMASGLRFLASGEKFTANVEISVE